jgi:hypothetical protein
MEIGTKCPKCEHQYEVTIDLRQVLDSLQTPDYDETVTSGDLIFYFTPMNYRQLNENSKINFEDQKLIQMLSDSEMNEEDKMAKLGDAFRKITQLTIASISASIGAIKTTDAMVTDPAQIKDFLHNCPKQVFDLIRDHAIKLRTATDTQPIQLTCDECNHEYPQSFVLDMSNFFVGAS